MLKNVNYTLVSLLVYNARLIIKGAGIGDAIGLAALCGLYGYSLYLDSKKEAPVNDQVRSELEQLRAVVNKLTVKTAFTRG